LTLTADVAARPRALAARVLSVAAAEVLQGGQSLFRWWAGYKQQRKSNANILVNTTVAVAEERQQPDAPTPINMGESLWAEELTFMEVRDKVHAGTTTIIIGTGGVEQNGPYVAGGKHNYVLQTVLPYIARAIGNVDLAPVDKLADLGRKPPNTARR